MTRHEQAVRILPPRPLKGAGALVIASRHADRHRHSARHHRCGRADAKPPLTPDQLSSFIAINQDGAVAAFCGKMDMGLGLHTAMAQIVAEELDVPYKAVTVTSATPQSP